MSLAATIKPGDWVSVRQAIAKLDRKLGPTSDPAFESVTLTDLTASRLVSSDTSKKLISVADLTNWIVGTINQIIVTDNGDGTVTLSAPQDIHTEASPIFAGLTTSGTIDASAGEVLVEDNATIEPTDKSDGYIGVTLVGDQPRMYFAVNGQMYYVKGVSTAQPETGMPIGLLLTLTYS